MEGLLSNVKLQLLEEEFKAPSVAKLQSKRYGHPLMTVDLVDCDLEYSDFVFWGVLSVRGTPTTPDGRKEIFLFFDKLTTAVEWEGGDYAIIDNPFFTLHIGK